jgi:hypothetical protein
MEGLSNSQIYRNIPHKNDMDRLGDTARLDHAPRKSEVARQAEVTKQAEVTRQNGETRDPELAGPDEKDQKVDAIENEKKKHRREEGGGEHYNSSQFQQDVDEAVEEKPVATQQSEPAKTREKVNETGEPEAFISKGSVRINDADEVIAVAKIYSHNKNVDVKPEVLARELNEKGIDCYNASLGANSAIRFASGDIFVDSNGNSELGHQDEGFAKAMSSIEQKFGINIDNLDARVQQQQLNQHEDSNGSIEGYGPMLDSLLNRGLEGQFGTGSVDRTFKNIDNQLQAKGFNGPQARDLHESGELEPLLAHFGIDVSPGDALDQEMSHASSFAQSIFKSALMISKIQN